MALRIKIVVLALLANNLGPSFPFVFISVLLKADEALHNCCEVY